MSAHGSTSGGGFLAGLLAMTLFFVKGFVAVLLVTGFIGGLWFGAVFFGGGKAAVKEKPRFSDVAAVQTEADHSRDLRAASLDRDEARSNFEEWPTYRLRNPKAPVFKVVGEGDKQIVHFLDTKGDWVPVDGRDEKNPEQPGHWNLAMKVHADLHTVHTKKGIAGTYVPAAQRQEDGLGYRQAWILREDLVIEEQPQPWNRNSMLRTASEDGGNREVVDRYTVVLEPGQMSTVLTYQMPFKADAERRNREGWYFNWRLRCDQEVLVTVNGHPYFGAGEIDTAEASSPSGGLAIEVTMPLTIRARQVPVEFTFYWHKEEKTTTATPVAQS